MMKVSAIVAAQEFAENIKQQKLTMIVKAGGYQAVRTLDFKFAHTYAEQLLLDFIAADKSSINGNGSSTSVPKSTNIDFILPSTFDESAPETVTAGEFRISNPNPDFAAIDITQANVRNFD